MQRNWQTQLAELHPGKGIASAELPEAATVAYLNLVDDRGCVVSGEHEMLSPKREKEGGEKC